MPYHFGAYTLATILRLPHPFVLLLGGVVLCTLLTWVLPAGEYQRRQNPELGSEVAASALASGARLAALSPEPVQFRCLCTQNVHTRTRLTVAPRSCLNPPIFGAAGCTSTLLGKGA